MGVNANFVQRLADGSLKVRTFEKGVEAETLACGTGLTACAIASWLDSHEGSRETAASSWGSVRVDLHARIADLKVDFKAPERADAAFKEVFLTGPAELVR